MDVFQYMCGMLQEILKAVQWQTGQLAKLQQDVHALQEKLAQFQNPPRTNVEKIDYNFEQLKVERLEGTLVIGLTGMDGGTIDDLQVAGSSFEDIHIGLSKESGGASNQQQTEPGQSSQDREDVNDQITRYIREFIPGLLDSQARARDTVLTAEDKERIMEDMIRQALERIIVYRKFADMKERGSAGPSVHDMLDRLKADIHQSVDRYIDWKLKEGEA